MSELIVTVDGDFFLDPELNHDVLMWPATSVKVQENVDVATITFGYADQDENFVAYDDGVVSEARILHGKGVRLMVRVAGKTANNVVIGFYAS